MYYYTTVIKRILGQALFDHEVTAKMVEAEMRRVRKTKSMDSLTVNEFETGAKQALTRLVVAK